MLHSDVLRLLMPVELGDSSRADLEREGALLDEVVLRDGDLLREMFADVAVETLAEWERVYGLTPGADDPVQLRQERLVNKIRSIGDIKAPHLVAVAAALGYPVTIEHLAPFMAGCNRCGDAIYSDTIWWQWKVSVSGSPAYYFRAGQSVAGERLSWYPTATDLEHILNDLKPADVYLWFVY